MGFQVSAFGDASQGPSGAPLGTVPFRVLGFLCSVDNSILK